MRAGLACILDTASARRLAEAALARTIRAGYEELVRHIDTDVHERLTVDEHEYQLETSITWDDARIRSIRVVVSVADGGWRAFVPLTVSDILTAPE